MDPDEGTRLREQAVSVGPPKRPRTTADLRFARRKPVSWFSPAVLSRSAQRVAISSALGEFLDKRELQQAVPARAPAARTEGDEVWFDYIADTGDGFDATYSVAWLAAQPRLAVEGVDGSLPRGALLVLGGDQVYPVASASEYENRFTRPLEASLPYTGDRSPALLALPGNHDWYDGLTSFTRAFCQGKWVGGRKTMQSRSYFAVELVAGWWLWGIDIQFDSYVDEAQLRYFEEAAGLMGEGGKVILCTAKPSWVDVASAPESFRNLAYLESRLIRPAGARLLLSLSGDSHHYAHYDADDGSHKVTAGGGGAFLHPTHHLDPDLDVPDEPTGERTQRYRLRDRRYPGAAESKRLSFGAILLPLRNPSFLLLPAVVYLILGLNGHFSVRARSGPRAGDDVARGFGVLDILTGLVGNPLSVVLLLLVLGGLIGFAKPPEGLPKGRRRSVLKCVMGSVHTVVQVGVGVMVGWTALKLSWPEDESAFGAVYLAWLVAIGSVASALTMGAYLAVCCRWLRAHGNEAFSAMALTRYKNFLRIHIDRDGVLTVYPIGLDRANDRWRVDGDNDDVEAPWLAPDGVTLRPRLVDAPIVIDPRR